MTWEKVKLGDLANSIQPGPFGSQLHSSDYSDKGTPIIMPKNMDDNRIDISDLSYINESHVIRLKRHQVHTENIVFARKGDVTKSIFITRKQDGWIVGSDCIKIDFKKDLFMPYFIYLQLQSPRVKNWLEMHAIGATMPSINSGILSEVEVYLPSMRAQQKIASILSAYDDLIENNRRQMKLLEEAAERLYKEWFVKFHYPNRLLKNNHFNLKDHTRVSLDSMGAYINGYAFKPSDWQTSGYPIIKIKEMMQGIEQDTPRNNGKLIPGKYVIQPGTIIFSWSA
ncbi:MAG: restriction endonuclease subunit S, partial [Syntrophomonadaceae bacterium]